MDEKLLSNNFTSYYALQGSSYFCEIIQKKAIGQFLHVTAAKKSKIIVADVMSMKTELRLRQCSWLNSLTTEIFRVILTTINNKNKTK